MQTIDITYIPQEKSLDNDNYLMIVLLLFLKKNLVLVFSSYPDYTSKSQNVILYLIRISF